MVVAGQTFCYGATGAVSRLRHGIQERVAIGFPSVAHIDGTRAEGPNGIAMLGIGIAHVTIGLEADPRNPYMFPELAGFGWRGP